MKIAYQYEHKRNCPIYGRSAVAFDICKIAYIGTQNTHTKHIQINKEKQDEKMHESQMRAHYCSF